jgi:hypothetical protein
MRRSGEWIGANNHSGELRAATGSVKTVMSESRRLLDTRERSSHTARAFQRKGASTKSRKGNDRAGLKSGEGADYKKTVIRDEAPPSILKKQALRLLRLA